MKINILGTDYTVKTQTEATDKYLIGRDGYCDKTTKEIVIDEFKETDITVKNLKCYSKTVLRHEIIHAFLTESGLDSESWAKNEEMVDWIALQFPKMLIAFKKAECVS